MSHFFILRLMEVDILPNCKTLSLKLLEGFEII